MTGVLYGGVQEFGGRRHIIITTHNLPEIKTLRKIAKTGSKPSKKYSPLSQTFAQ